MKSQFEIKDKIVIDDILNNSEYGTLALCNNNIPYSIPINFVQVNNCIYFHGAKKGKKIHQRSARETRNGGSKDEPKVSSFKSKIFS